MLGLSIGRSLCQRPPNGQIERTAHLGAMVNSGCQPPATLLSHHTDRIEPSGAAQKTSRWYGNRLTALTDAPGTPLPAGAMMNSGCQPPATLLSHHTDRIEPSG